MLYVITGTCPRFFRKICEDIVKQSNDFFIDNFKVVFKNDFMPSFHMKRKGLYNLDKDDSKIFFNSYSDCENGVPVHLKKLWDQIPNAVYNPKIENTFLAKDLGYSKQTIKKIYYKEIERLKTHLIFKNNCTYGIFDNDFINLLKVEFGIANVKVINIVKYPADYINENIDLQLFEKIINNLDLNNDTYKIENLSYITLNKKINIDIQVNNDYNESIKDLISFFGFDKKLNY